MVEVILWLFALLIVATLWSMSRPTKYRIRRSPGSTKYWIETRNGFFHSSEKHYIGGGETGYPEYARTYFDNLEAANTRMYELIKRDKRIRKDKGSVGPWHE